MSNLSRCVLVGAESLLIQCGLLLEQRGVSIAAVVSGATAIRQWAGQRGCHVFADADALAAATDLAPFDHLFSITHLAVLPAEVLALPTRAAINFHDGPLPDYGGLNTPVWALLNDERRHGISWHLMTDRVDSGAVLMRREIEVSPTDTALTLNTKCFEAGIDSFAELIELLEREPLAVLAPAQPPERCYSRRDRPASACAVDWVQPAQRIATLVRALDHGAYANPVGVAKASLAAQPFIIGVARATDARSDLPPGTIVAVGATHARVATADVDLEIEGLRSLDGRDLDVAQHLASEAGRPARLDALDASLAETLTALNTLVCAHEGWWARRLETVSPFELPYVDRSLPPVAPRIESLDLALPPAFAGEARSDDRIAGVLAWLARLGDKEAFDIGFSDTALMTAVAGVEAWFATQVPVHAAIRFDAGFADLRATVAHELSTVRKHRSFARDLVARTPALRTRAATGAALALPVAVIEVERLDAVVAPPGSELTLVFTRDGAVMRWLYDAAKLARVDVERMQQQLAVFMDAAAADPQRPLGQLPLSNDTIAGRERMLSPGNVRAEPADACVHRHFEQQAARTPDRTALIFDGRSMTYAELDARANQLARRLAAFGVGPDVLVGLCVERSIEMLVGLIAIHKAGGAYVPLDPVYPKDRIAHMVDDSRIAVLLTQQRLLDELPRHGARVICLDSDWPSIAAEPASRFDGGAQPQQLAYVIYTSGSTGKPKGVMVEHRNVVNFFCGMDERIGADEPGVWLAVTSLSFDISVLELCWTLARGYTVVVAPDEDRRHAGPARGAHAQRPIDFSLFYFSSDESEGRDDKYGLLLEGSKYADRHGFAAVWTPERHFHAFGGLYPNPAVAGAAIAAVTDHVQIRAGSVVLPLHHPIRVAEEWSVVDNISKGRVGLSFASGWQPDDFVLRPGNFADAKNVMLREIETVRRLWRGETLDFDGPLGKPVALRILPRPVQAELPFWVTSAGNPDTFIAAGRLGANVLTHLLGQTIDELADKLKAYRQARKEAGHAGEGCVSLMLHSFVGPDADAVRERVRRPLIEYLRSSMNLVKQYAWSFPAFKRREGMDTSPGAVDLQSLSPDEMDALLEHSFERYYETSGLFGTPESCLAMVDRMKAIGVDDVACLIDFGIDSTTVLEHLPYLNRLRLAATPRAGAEGDRSLAALMQRHGVTHLQCTPSMARLLLTDGAAAPGLAALKRLMIGGEAFPPSLAKELKGLLRGELMNMYGPTETTIWSSVHGIDAVDGAVPLGRALANQQLHVLDSRQQPVPAGVPGELVIGGHGVVRGYLRRPELTAERFIADPFDARPGARLYRTGDLARYRPDGTLDFLGRLDHQVKLRGYRIELGEIESVLLEQTGVREAVVVAREDTPGDLRLVAYVVPAVSSDSALPQWRDALRNRLPEYMVPAHFVSLTAMPQTPNGKIDRKALPAPESGPAAVATAAFVAPRSELEQTIATIWRDVLKLPQVGTRDNFFDLGGHSLLAVQAHRRLRDTLGRTLSITDIFRFPTIHSLSTYLDEGHDGAAAQQVKDRAEGRRAAMQRRQAVRPGASRPN